MKILIASSNMVDLSTVKVKRTDNAHVELSTSDVLLSAHDDTWREIIKRVQALLDAPKVKHPGWVFEDQSGDAWGWVGYLKLSERGVNALRPYLRREEAEEAANSFLYGETKVREWRRGDLVPPLPEGWMGVP